MWGSPHADSVARLLGHPGFGQAADGWQLPYRAQIPKGLDGLLVTGKPACIFIHYNGTVAAAGHGEGAAGGMGGQDPAAADQAEPRRWGEGGAGGPCSSQPAPPRPGPPTSP